MIEASRSKATVAHHAARPSLPRLTGPSHPPPTTNRNLSTATQDPCAFVRLISLGALNAETNARLSSEIASLSSAEYQVPANRLYIEFVGGY